MKMTRSITAGALLMIATAGAILGQNVEVARTAQSQTHWVAVKRHVMAVTYKENKQTTVNMSSTEIAPRSIGKADVEFKQGRTNVRLEMDSLANPQSLGGFYTAYVLWAVAPEGQTVSLMELPIEKKFKIESTTNFQTFGLMITAEPHSRVVLPSSMIIAENTLRRGTEGMITTSKIEYSGDPGTFYALFLPESPTTKANYNTPLGILGARRSVEIAERAGAKEYAEPEYREAADKLETLEQIWPRSRKPSDLRDSAKKNSGLSHDVMRLGEQARSLSVERSSQARLAAERLQASDDIAQAQTEADRARIEAERARSSERFQSARAAAQAAIARTRIEEAQSETAKAKANEDQARDDADAARLQTEEARRQRDAAQQRLYLSLSEIMETRREARGLIVNLSDVLFDTGKASLKSGAREKLSKLAGVLAGYAGEYRIEIEGHTDSVGSNESNLNLSRGRAESVRDYLTQNGVKSERVTATRGFGETTPVAGNETAAGRQVNRRVEIIIADQFDRQAKTGNQ